MELFNDDYESSKRKRNVLHNSLSREYRDVGTITVVYIYIKYKTHYFLFGHSTNRKSHMLYTLIFITNEIHQTLIFNR